MRQYKYILVSILSFIFIPLSIKGAVCSNSDKVRYQALAKNISVSYDYTEESENTKFNISFINIPDNFYFKNMDNKQVYPYSGNEMTITNMEQGKSLKYGGYVNSSGCDGILLYTYYITLPYYNPYYSDKLCEGIIGFNYCNKWVNKKITYDEFKKNVEKYKNRIDFEENIPKEEEKTSLFTIILDFYLHYYYFILPIIIVIGIIVIKRYNKKQELF